MQYEELALPDALLPFVRAVWRMRGEAHRDATIRYQAMPDGCVEVIRRLRGRSTWNRPQPDLFVAGMCSEPAELELTGDAEFLGIRLWPWAWNSLGQSPCPTFHDRWLPLEENSPAGQLLAEPSACIARLEAAFAQVPDPIACHVPNSRRTGELVDRSGRNHRAIQRWFQTQIGLSPRKYFRLLRFQRAVELDTPERDTLAGQAASLGYADQAHMSRDFRTYARSATSRVRKRARGPFLEG